jgi:hypothetical protein
MATYLRFESGDSLSRIRPLISQKGPRRISAFCHREKESLEKNADEIAKRRHPVAKRGAALR